MPTFVKVVSAFAYLKRKFAKFMSEFACVISKSVSISAIIAYYELKNTNVMQDFAQNNDARHTTLCFSS